MDANGLSDSYVEEEIGECLAVLGRPDKAASHFSAAVALLDAGGLARIQNPTDSRASAASRIRA